MSVKAQISGNKIVGYIIVGLLFFLTLSLTSNIYPVSYTHLDVYKRQGNARYQLMDKIAREISFEAGYTVRSSTLVQYLIDNFSDSARVSILEDLSIRNEKG